MNNKLTLTVLVLAFPLWGLMQLHAVVSSGRDQTKLAPLRAINHHGGAAFFERGQTRRSNMRKSSLPDQDSLIRTCFSGLFRASQQRLTPNFVMGDFDGDGQNDLLVAVELARVVDRNDRGAPPFNFQEVLDSRSPASEALDLRMGNLQIFEMGPFFAVIHNIGRSPNISCSRAQNKFVLLFTMDKGTKTMRLFTGKKLPRGTIGDEKEDQPPPRLRGKAILLLDNQGSGTALYWEGTRYRWYPFQEVDTEIIP
jgi:hypothetical protein